MMKNTANLPAQQVEILKKGRQTRPSDLDPNYEELKTIGYGWEGYVYLVRDRATGRKLVLKIFHSSIASDGLKRYADGVRANEYGLSPITLLQEPGGIVALQYPFVRLHYVNYRLCTLSSYTAKSLFGQFCLMQWYLMSHHGIGLADPRRSNCLLASDGRFHYVDYGQNVFSLTDSRALAKGFLGYGFAMLLLDMYNINLAWEMPYSSGYSYDRACVYSMCEALDTVAAKHNWVREILSQVRSQDASNFLDPEFYRRLGMSLPRRVRSPQIIILASEFLGALSSVRDLVRTECLALLLLGGVGMLHAVMCHRELSLRRSCLSFLLTRWFTGGWWVA
jgi:hypothetical protein